MRFMSGTRYDGRTSYSQLQQVNIRAGVRPNSFGYEMQLVVLHLVATNFGANRVSVLVENVMCACSSIQVSIRS